MYRFARPLFAVLLGAGAVFGVSTAGQAADLGAYVGDPGVCGQSWVLGKITSRFRHQVNNVPNLPNVQILDFQGIHENRYLPAEEDRPIGRRYCGATAVMSDGQGRDIWYLIEEGQGLASIGDNVEFCVSGFDRWYVYNGRCRVLR